MENAYFQALSHAHNSTGQAWADIFDQLDSSLHADLAIKIAEQNREKVNVSGLEQYLTTPGEEAAFIKSLCVGLSSRIELKLNYEQVKLYMCQYTPLWRAYLQDANLHVF